MKKILAALLVFSLLSCSKPDMLPPSVAQTYIDKFDFIMDVTSDPGQSNMCGTIPTKVTEPSKGVNIMAWGTPAADSFQVLQKGVNASHIPTFYGIQAVLGDSLYKYRKKEIYIFQPARGGTSIDKWAEGGFMWTYIQKSIPIIKAKAKKEHKMLTFKNTIWYQGEGDVMNVKWDSSVYRKALESFIDRYRTEINYDTRFIIVQIPDACMQIPAQKLKEIQDVQLKVGSQRNNVLIPKDPADKCQGDNLHLTRETYFKKANEIFKIIR